MIKIIKKKNPNHGKKSIEKKKEEKEGKILSRST